LSNDTFILFKGVWVISIPILDIVRILPNRRNKPLPSHIKAIVDAQLLCSFLCCNLGFGVFHQFFVNFNFLLILLYENRENIFDFLLAKLEHSCVVLKTV
jgi:hypothetical protein